MNCYKSIKEYQNTKPETVRQRIVFPCAHDAHGIAEM